MRQYWGRVSFYPTLKTDDQAGRQVAQGRREARRDQGRPLGGRWAARRSPGPSCSAGGDTPPWRVGAHSSYRRWFADTPKKNKIIYVVVVLFLLPPFFVGDWQCCGSGMFIPDLDSGSNNCTKRRGEKSFCPTIFCSHKYHKIVNNFIFEQVKNIFCQNTKKTFVIKLSNNGFGIRDPEKPFPGSSVKKAPDPGSGSATLGGGTCAVRNYGQRFYYLLFYFLPNQKSN